jgi:hypothetical protein
VAGADRPRSFAGVEGKDLQLTTAAGPDLYWAFMAKKP